MEVEEVFARFRDIKHGIKTRKKSTSIHYGDHKSGFKGAGYDIVGVDQWRPGQPLKDIAWMLSLRTYPEKLFRIERMEPRSSERSSSSTCRTPRCFRFRRSRTRRS